MRSLFASRRLKNPFVCKGLIAGFVLLTACSAPVAAQELERIVQEMTTAMNGIYNYHYRMERDDGMSYASEGDVDIENGRSHITVHIARGELRHSVELYWTGENTYGYSPHAKSWFNIAAPPYPASRLHNVFSLMRFGRTEDLRESELDGVPMWRLTVIPNIDAYRENPRSYTDPVFSPLKNGTEHDRELLEEIHRGIQKAQLTLHVWAAKDTYRIHQAVLAAALPGFETRYGYFFSKFNDNELSIKPPRNALEASGPKMPLSSLFIHLPGIQ